MNEDQIEAAEEQGPDGIPALMEGLNDALDNNEEEVAESILDACLRMSSSTDVCDKLGNYLAGPLSKTFKVMMEEAVVMEVMLAVLTRVITSQPTQMTFGSEENIQLLLSVMSTHKEGEETLIEYACLVIEKLALDNQETQKILLTHGVKDQLEAAQDIITNVRNKKYVGQARAALKLEWVSRVNFGRKNSHP